MGSAAYAEPRLLWDAKPATTPALSVKGTGNQITLTRPAGLTGVYWLNITASDGQLNTTKSVMVILN